MTEVNPFAQFAVPDGVAVDEDANPFAQFALKDEAPKPNPREGRREWAISVPRAGPSALTAGHADELAGAVGSLGNKVLRAGADVPLRALGKMLPSGWLGGPETVPGATYSDIRNEQDQAIRDFRETNPVAAYGTEVGAGFALPLGAGANLLRGGLTGLNVLKGAATGGAPMGGGSGAG